MNWLNTFISEDILFTLGWTILHALWQGTLLAIILSLGMFILNKNSAQTRYAIAVTALFTMLVVSAITFWVVLPTQAELNAQASTENLDTIPLAWEPMYYYATHHVDEGILSNVTLYFNSHLPLIVTIWLMGVLVFTLKMLGGLAYIQRLKTYRVKQAEAYWQNKVLALSTQMGIKKIVRLMESTVVHVPMVVGHLKPVILLPVGTITGLSPEQLEAILAHELAHIARHDFLVNILQSVVDIVFFYHPGIWWISKVIREEREHCCDDLAVAYNKDSLTFAKALAQLQQKDWLQPELAVAINGKKSSLQYRIERLLDFSENTKNLKTTFQEGFFTAVILTLAILGFSFTLHQVSQEEQNAVISTTTEVEDVNAENKNVVIADTTKNNLSDITKLSFTMADGRYIFAKLDSTDNISELFIEGVKIAPEDFDNNKEVVVAVKKNLMQIRQNREQLIKQKAQQQIALEKLRLQERELSKNMREQERIALMKLREQQKAEKLQEEQFRLQDEQKRLKQREQEKQEIEYLQRLTKEQMLQKQLELERLEIEKQQNKLRLERERAELEKAAKEGEISKAELQERMLEYEKQNLSFKAEELAIKSEIEKLKYDEERNIQKIAEVRSNQIALKERQRTLRRDVKREVNIQREVVRKKVKEEKIKYNKFKEKIIPELIKDGLIKSEKDHIQFKITNNELLLNCEVQGEKLHKKYLKLLKKGLNEKLENGQTFEVHYHSSTNCE